MTNPLQEPALPAPEGQQSHLGSTSGSEQPIWIGITAVIIALPTILVPLRFYIKVFLLRNFQLTDYVVLLAWSFHIALCSLGLALLPYGVGIHAWNLTLNQYSNFARVINIQQIVYMPAICFTKVSILLQLIDIFIPMRKTRRWWMLHGLIVFNCVFFLLLFFLETFECIPRQKIWKPSLPGHCINIEKTFIATGVINVVDDFVLLILPLRWVWSLNAPTSRKLAVCAIFATGLFACVSSIMRLAETIINLGNPDITHALLPVSLWASVEPAVGLVIVCMPVLPRLFNNTSPKAATFSYGTSGSHGNARSKPSVNSTLINDVYTEIDGGNWRSDSLQRLAPKVTGQQAISMDTIQTDAAYRSPEEFSADPKRDRWMKQQSKSEIMKTVSVEQHRD